MKKFLWYVLLFVLLLAISIYGILLRADGYTDSNYLRFTTPKQNSMIFGTSKAAQGLRPEVINGVLDAEIYNYSFDIGKSPYGPKYLESINRKLAKRSKKGLFILTVDCWSISSNPKNPNDSTAFRENHTCVGAMKTVDRNPNFQYLTQYMSGHYYSLIAKSSIALLHDDGWFEVSLDTDSVSVNRRTKSTLQQFKQYEKVYKYSQLRFDYLIKTITFLNQYGDVYLVRLPVSSELMAIENRLQPEFNDRMQLASAKARGYLDLTNQNEQFHYIDGVHLDKESGKEVSGIVAKWVKNNN